MIDVSSHQIIKRVPGMSPFSRNIAVSPENDEVWITLKDTGKVQVYSAKPPFEQKALLDTGPITVTVTFVNNGSGKFRYFTVGGLGEVKVFDEVQPRNWWQPFTLENCRMVSGRPAMGSRVYVALENSVEAVAIDTLANKVIAQVPIGRQPRL